MMEKAVERTVLAVSALAATAAAAAMGVWAAGFALYALVEPSIGRAGAGAVVALIAAALLAAAAAYTAKKAKSKKESREIAKASVIEEDHGEPMVGANPLALVMNIVRDKPVIALGLSLAAGIVAARQPQMVREFASLLSAPSTHRR